MRPQLEKVEWTVADIPCLIEDWTCSESANFGFERMSGRADAAWGEFEQGMPVSGYTTDGECVWAGRIISPPKRVLGSAFIEAVGFGQVAAKSGTAELVQSADLRDWQIETGATGGGTLAPQFAHGVVKWSIAGGTTTADEEEAGILFVAEGQFITRVAWTGNEAGNNTTGLRFRLYAGDPLAIVGGDRILDANHDVNITTGPDQIALRLADIGGPTTYPGSNYVWITNLRVNGNYAGDSIGTADVISQVAARLQYDITDNIEAGVVPANPLFFRGNYAALFTWLANWDLYRWGVWENRRGLGPIMEYGPYGPTYTTYLSDGAIEDLEPLELYNVARSDFDTVDGVMHQLFVEADPDPLEKWGVRNELAIRLPERQLDETAAEAVARRAMDYYSQQRVRGTIMVGATTDEAGASVSPRKIRAGSMLYIGDYDPPLVPQRIVGKSMTPTSVVLEITERDPLIGRSGLPSMDERPVSVGVAGVTNQHLTGDVDRLPWWIDPSSLFYNPWERALGTLGPPNMRLSRRERMWAEYLQYIQGGGIHISFAAFMRLRLDRMND